jgi:NADPH:quinone reductase-like Zn-dependent oxidoreductase
VLGAKIFLLVIGFALYGEPAIAVTGHATPQIVRLVPMKTVIVKAPGGLDHLTMIDTPDPGLPGPGEIRVKLRASSLNYHDFGCCNTPGRVADGRIPMSDGAGVVDGVGEGVTEFKPGDHVVSCFFPDWRDGPPLVPNFSRVPGDGIDGYAREAVVVPAHWFTRAPRGYTHAEAATITTAGLTAWRALIVNGPLKAGDVVLVLGTGGVSIYALQLAKAMGATVIATSSSDEKLERVKALGADHIINYRQTPEWGNRVMELTDGIGADHVIEVGGPGTLPQSITACRVAGHISLIGVLTGRAGEVPTGHMMVKQIRLHGLIVGSRSHQVDFVRALEATGIRPVIDSSFGLSQLANAFRHEAAGRHFGKICLDI